MRSHPLLLVILAGLAGCQVLEPAQETQACRTVSDTVTTCDAADDVDPDDLTVYGWCGSDVISVDGEGTLTTIDMEYTGDTDGGTPACCYPVTARNTEPNCVIGRPYMEDCEVVVAPVRAGGGWSVAAGTADADRASRWLKIAQGEHASVASFARLTLELIALGAPADLVADVQQAAADEIEHARLAFGLASRFAGTALEPGRLPMDARLHLTTDLADLAEAAVREGCLGETVGAWLASEAATSADDPAERAVLVRITADESRHAALSYRLVAWLMEQGGEPVRERVRQAFAEPFGVSDPLGEVTQAQCAQVHQQVLAPAYQALMAV